MIGTEKRVKRISSRNCHPILLELPKIKDEARLGDMKVLLGQVKKKSLLFTWRVFLA